MLAAILLAQVQPAGAYDPDDPSHPKYNGEDVDSTPEPSPPITPPHQSSGQDVVGPLTWSAAGGTHQTRYVVDLGTHKPLDGNQDRICHAQVELSCSRENAGRLQPDTVYYWQVTSIDGVGAQPGPVWEFRTGSPLPEAYDPVPPSPSSGNGVNGLLSWSGSGTDSTWYVVDLSKTNPPNGATDRICEAQAAKSCPRENLGTLEEGTTYYWQVTAIDGIGANPGPVWQFTTAGQGSGLPMPYNPSPGSPAWDEQTTGRLRWDANGNQATRYVVDLSTSNPPQGSTDRICHAQSHKVCDRASLGPLNPGTKYYWRVTSIDGIGARAGPVWEFTTSGQSTSLPMPSGPSPASPSWDEPRTGPLSWSADGTPQTQYVVDLGPVNPPNGVTDRICHAQTSKICNRENDGVLDPGTKYFWRVTSIDGIGARAGPVWEFTTAAEGTPLPEPHSPNPASPSAGQATTGALAWSAEGTAATQYVVDLSKTNPPNGATDRICQAQTAKSCQRENLGALSPGTTYYWRVTSIDGVGANPGDVWQFTTQGSAPSSLPEAENPTPPSPSSKQAVTGPLTWEAVGTDATRYVVDISRNPVPNGATDRICHAQTTLSCNRENLGVLSPGATYYWVVTSIDGIGANPGPVWQFTTEAAPSEPQGLLASTPGHSQVRLDWSLPQNPGDSAVSAYRIYAQENGMGPAAKVGEVPAHQRWFIHDGLSLGERLYFVAAVNNAGEGPSAGPAAALPYFDYHVELRAWIPHAKVVDPACPGEGSCDYYGQSQCPGSTYSYTPFFSKVSRWFEGDNHVDYDGTFRLRSQLKFHWNGVAFTEPDSVPAEETAGMTHRWARFEDRATGYWEQCMWESARVPSGAVAHFVGSETFQLRYQAPNPLTVSPDVDGVVDGRFLAGGDLQLDWQTDEFPSHAFRIVKNGIPQLTLYATDASCLSQSDVMGWDGAVTLADGLTSSQAHGSRILKADEYGQEHRVPSEKC